MKNVSDFKKRIVKGTKLHCTFHQFATGRNDKRMLIFGDQDRGTREVNKVMSTQFTLLTTNQNGEVLDSYINFPPASKCKIIDENSIMYLDEDFRVHDNPPLIPLLTYTFVK